jgi:hypothetical protein
MRGVLAASLLAALALVLVPYLWATPPRALLVEGRVFTTGRGTAPYDITFYAQDGRYFYALVRDGSFSLTLPGPGRYHVTVTWRGPDYWEFGTVDMGYVTLSGPQGGGPASLSLVVPSPDMPLC